MPASAVADERTPDLATANAAGQPYAQHRGGPKGFIRMIGPRTLGFADYTGNKQFISTGNLAENDKAFLFLMDYAHRRRVKIWGRAQVVTDDATLIERLMPEGYRARAEQAIVFEVAAWDINCSQHIPQRSMPRMSPKRWLDWKVGSPNSKPRILPFGQEWKVIVHEPSA